jgi:hypothetical protein
MQMFFTFLVRTFVTYLFAPKNLVKNIKKNLHIPTAIINFAAVYNKIKNHYGAYR